jgi:AraC-like DNA-binding protein
MIEMIHEQIIPNINSHFKIFEFESEDHTRQILPHWHSSAELLFCIDGHLEIKYLNATYSIKKEELCFINSNVVHSTRTLVNSKILVMQIPYEFLIECTEGTYDNEIYFKKKIEVDSKLLELLTTIRKEIKIATIPSRMIIHSKIYDLLACLMLKHTIPVSRIKKIQSMKHLDKQKSINTYIQENCTQNITLETISKEFNYNPSYFSRFFKKNMGETFTSYLKTVRLNLAYTKLEQTDLTIMDIANECGFGNVKSFYLAFTSEYGVSPQVYRNRFKK